MTSIIIKPTKNEIHIDDNEFIVTKTDAKGRITYCNQVFAKISGYSPQELRGKPHSIVRHPDMPRTVFSLLWQTIQAGDEFLGYVKNLSKDGSFYWVFATVTASYSSESNCNDIIGFFSVRRKPNRLKIKMIEQLYQEILEAEKKVMEREQISAGTAVLTSILDRAGKDYHEFILTL